jgi:hypothetical protein
MTMVSVIWSPGSNLTYPVLLLVGVKLFVEEFLNGRPSTPFIALALVGGALIVVAKL